MSSGKVYFAMIATLIAALVAGCIVGPLARLILPGKQNISVGLTILLGAVGSLLGTWLGSLFFDYEGGQLNFTGLILGVIGALIVVVVYGAVAGRRSTAGRIT